MSFPNVGRALPQMSHTGEGVVELRCTSRPSGLHLGVLRPTATHHILPVDAGRRAVMKVLKCPSCGASLDGGTEFLIVERYETSHTYVVEGQDYDGAIVAAGSDGGDAERFIGKPEVHCGECRHAWPTTRRWRRT